MKETIEMINKTKSWFFEKINKIGNEKGQVTTDNAEIQMIMRLL